MNNNAAENLNELVKSIGIPAIVIVAIGVAIVIFVIRKKK